MKTLEEYQNFANKCSGYEFDNLNTTQEVSHELTYNILGLSGESAELLEKINKLHQAAVELNVGAGKTTEKLKKAIRNSNINEVFDYLNWSNTKISINDIALELGDVLFYTARIADMLGLSLTEIAKLNKKKLEDRVERGVVKGEGDSR